MLHFFFVFPMYYETDFSPNHYVRKNPWVMLVLRVNITLLFGNWAIMAWLNFLYLSYAYLVSRYLLFWKLSSYKWNKIPYGQHRRRPYRRKTWWIEEWREALQWCRRQKTWWRHPGLPLFSTRPLLRTRFWCPLQMLSVSQQG